MRIGFVGLGKMGSPMARRLGAAGAEVSAYDLRAGARAALSGAEGVAPVDRIADAAEGAEIVITMLPDGAAVAAAANALRAALRPGATFVDMSTAAPAEVADLRRAAPDAVAVVDAPVSGGVARAETGDLTIMAGGDAAIVAKIASALRPLGRITRTGPLGSGRAMKLLNNYLSASGLIAACEALAVGEALGLDPDLMAETFNRSTGRNNATEVKMKQQINSRAFASGFAMGLMAKDLRLCAQMAAEGGLSIPGLSAAQDLFEEGVARFGGEADHTEIARLFLGDGR